MFLIIEFFKRHGGPCLMIRRHFESRRIETCDVLDKDIAVALRLARLGNDGHQGLSSLGEGRARRQGRLLAHLGLIPDAIIAGIDQRNLDGALATAEGISSLQKDVRVPVFSNPAITYPYYGDLGVCVDAFRRYGDLAVHKFLSGKFRGELQCLWVESPEVFEARLMGAVRSLLSGNSQFGWELWDLNFEQLIALHQLLVEKKPLFEIESEDGAYIPDYGSGIAIAQDGAVAEFDRRLAVYPGASRKK